MPEITLSLGSAMGCRRCVREVTGRLRDVPGVETVSADAGNGTVVLGGTMTIADVLAAFDGSDYVPRVIGDSTAATAP